jgi:hypothetical protein
VNYKNKGGMDLDALKAGINSRLEQPVTSKPKMVVCKLPRSRGLLMKLRRNLWLETSFYLIATPIMLFEAWRTELLALSIYLVTFSVVMTMLTPVFARLARRITRHIHSDTTVQEGLKELVDIMKTYQRRYLQFNLIMVPFFLIYSIVLGIAFPGSDVGDNTPDNPAPPVWVFLLIVIIGLSLLMVSTWYIAKWWIHWLYGRYIRDLEAELRDVEAEE